MLTAIGMTEKERKTAACRMGKPAERAYCWTIFGGDAPERWGGQSETSAARFEPCSRGLDFIVTVAWSGCPQQALHRQSSLIWSHGRCITEQELRLLNGHFFQADGGNGGRFPCGDTGRRQQTTTGSRCRPGRECQRTTCHLRLRQQYRGGGGRT
ncbi:unnamed protein product [Pleuronectes platessa]|uniref:Uncharacterized protein n=1 Tax=Pleuronectes platessa TaxID=8262 RepID=A0A9N7W1R5_PLEPL|nr:unnamed protein product [Pleuronectes platessa]